MTDLIKKPLSQKHFRALALSVLPKANLVSEYIGLSFDTITKQHPNCNIAPIDNDVLTIEIRLDKSTLTCRIQNNICTDAYLFDDSLLNIT